MMQLSYLLMGTFLDDTAMLVIVAPLYVPLVISLRFGSIWYGVLYAITCQIAYMTPPFGYNLFLMRATAPPQTWTDSKEIAVKNPTAAVVLTIMATSLLLAGCVSKEKYDALEKENTELRATNTQLSEGTTFLSGQLLESDREVAVLEQQQAALSDEVARWATVGAVKMELLRNGLQITFPNEVLFATGSADLKLDGQHVLKELVGALEEVPYQIVVIGHTDNVPIGPALAKRYPSNWELAGARAASVVRLMAGEGIPPQQLLAISMGDTRPVASNDTPAGRAENRRIDVRIRPVVRR
jgi:flagellar motor protein MotB